MIISELSKTQVRLKGQSNPLHNLVDASHRKYFCNPDSGCQSFSTEKLDRKQEGHFAV
jgi:hypothetical protein